MFFEVFKSLSIGPDHKKAYFLKTAAQKLTPHMKESLWLFIVKKQWTRPTLLDFNDQLKEKDEAHNLAKTWSKARTEDITNSVAKTKVASKTSAAHMKIGTLRNQLLHRQRLQPFAARCGKVTTAYRIDGYVKKSFPLNQQR